MKSKIIVIEDEVSINDILVSSFNANGYESRGVLNSADAKGLLKNFNAELAILDINLPDEDGFELCRFITTNYFIPIIILTARNDIVDKVLGLELGADDYITKPFNIKEVLTRVKVALRRVDKYKNNNNNGFSEVNKSLKVDFKSRIIVKNGEEVKLKPKEFDLLYFLFRNKNIIFSREDLLDKVWGIEYLGDLRTVDVHIRRLRSKLDVDSTNSIIETVFGVGYVMR